MIGKLFGNNFIKILDKHNEIWKIENFEFCIEETETSSTEMFITLGRNMEIFHTNFLKISVRIL